MYQIVYENQDEGTITPFIPAYRTQDQARRMLQRLVPRIQDKFPGTELLMGDPDVVWVGVDTFYRVCETQAVDEPL